MATSVGRRHVSLQLSSGDEHQNKQAKPSKLEHAEHYRSHHGRDQGHLLHRGRGDALPRQDTGLPGARHSTRLQEHPQQTGLQVLLQVNGR